jgi:uncharacterized protein (DUF486 family)
MLFIIGMVASLVFDTFDWRKTLDITCFFAQMGHSLPDDTPLVKLVRQSSGILLLDRSGRLAAASFGTSCHSGGIGALMHTKITLIVL